MKLWKSFHGVVLRVKSCELYCLLTPDRHHTFENYVFFYSFLLTPLFHKCLFYTTSVARNAETWSPSVTGKLHPCYALVENKCHSFVTELLKLLFENAFKFFVRNDSLCVSAVWGRSCWTEGPFTTIKCCFRCNNVQSRLFLILTFNILNKCFFLN